MKLIRSAIFNEDPFDSRAFAVVSLFMPSYRLYRVWPEGLLHRVCTIIKDRFDLLADDFKTKNLLKVKTNRFLEKLAEVGYLTKSKSEEDKRMSIFHFTEAAKRAYASSREFENRPIVNYPSKSGTKFQSGK